MRKLLVVLSVVNVLAGVALMVLFALIRPMAPGAAFLAIVLIVQGGYTLLYHWRGWERSESAYFVLTGASVIALVVGGVAFVFTAMRTLDPDNLDPEYGPLLAISLVTGHAAFALISEMFGKPRANRA